MNVKNVVKELKQKYPNKRIILNDDNNPTEILCEVDPSKDHPKHSLVVAIIDSSQPHVHMVGKEIYKVIKGELKLFISNEKHDLKTGEKITIYPNQPHWAEGNETWIECSSEPGWRLKDHLLIDRSKFAISTYDKIADKYTQMYFNDLTDTPYIDEFIKLLPAKARILDIGCGPGTFTKYFYQHGLNVEGIDLSQEMIKIAKSKVSGVTFKVMDMRELKYPRNTFDGILAGYSIIHIPSNEIVATFKGFYKALKNKGLLMIIAQKGSADKIVNAPLAEGEKVFINFFTKKRLQKFLSDSGFTLLYQKEKDTQDPESLSDKVIYTIAGKK